MDNELSRFADLTPEEARLEVVRLKERKRCMEIILGKAKLIAKLPKEKDHHAFNVLMSVFDKVAETDTK